MKFTGLSDIYKLQEKIGAAPEDGSLYAAESRGGDVPFDILRVYYIAGTKSGVVRGNHAHKKLEQVLICVNGEIEISLDDGRGGNLVRVLKSPCDAVYVAPGVWRAMKWLKDDSVLLVLASEHYDESDYIKSYQDFIEWIKGGKL